MVDRDTTPDAHRVQLEVLRRMGPSRRGAVAVELSEDMRRITEERIARDHPHLDRRSQVRILVSQLYGESLAVKAFGPAER